MATVRSSTSHEERTAAQPRQATIESVVVGKIDQVNPTIRKIRLQSTVPGHPVQTQFLPGQWLDVFIPGLPKAGGFTITSPRWDRNPLSRFRPIHEAPEKVPNEEIEIAVQNSANPPAKWFHQPESDILGTELKVRAGGSFTLPPPPPLSLESIERLILIGGGVGINPFQSMVQDMRNSNDWLPKELKVLYATKAVAPFRPREILFVNELRQAISEIQRRSPSASVTKEKEDMQALKEREKPDLKLGHSCDAELKLFLTGIEPQDIKETEPPKTQSRLLETAMKVVAGRITEKDLDEVLGKVSDRELTLVYVCGPKAMTDTFVEYIGSRTGMAKSRVLCEKWW